MTTLLGVTNSLARIACFTVSTCIKGVDREAVSIEGTYIKGFCTWITSVGGAGGVD